METHMEPQYAVVNGRNTDMDIEDVFDHISRRDYSDPLLNSVFWRLMQTYYKKGFQTVAEKFDPLPSVEELARNRELLTETVISLQVNGESMTTEEAEIPEPVCDEYPGYDYAATIICPAEDEEYTDFTLGATPAHATVLALVQRCREISEANLNRAEGQSLH